jgi:short subunit dehydrogenase-like uncharacterized protein
MREKYGSVAGRSGARIISFCGFDSVPSDLSVYVAVKALREATKKKDKSIEIVKATTWHSCQLNSANGGTLRTVIETSINLKTLFRLPVPFLLDDPLALCLPKLRNNPETTTVKNRLALAEWMNIMPHFDSLFHYGVSIPFVMAPINTKVVHASAIALKYGPNFVYNERYLPTGYRMTTQLGVLSIIPAFITQLGFLIFAAVVKLPVIGSAIVNLIAPPGSGPSEEFCQQGLAEVYSEVRSSPDPKGKVTKANCRIVFKGDPSNSVTSQCVCEAAMALAFDKDDLPPKSEDGFGTPAELLGDIFLARLKGSKVRPVKFEFDVRMGVEQNEHRMFP